jgi:hypothetical protein
VTKASAWYRQHLPAWFADIVEHAVGGYTVFQAQRRRPDRSVS